jgi:hypothetical protein
MDFIKYLEKLDIYIVSHGGVASNALQKYLYVNKIKTNTDKDRCNDTLCHSSIKYTDNVKTLYV